MSALNILALNSGSSSLKFGLYRVDSAGAEKLIGETFSTVSTVSTLSTLSTVPTADHPDVMTRVASALAASGMPAPDAIGHCVVHGGPALRQHWRIDDAVLRQQQAAAAFAPLHTPAALALIRSTQAHFPGIAQVACFDTQFHAGLPEVARVLPLARELLSEGMQRYGFHGLSLESIVRQLGPDLPERLIAAMIAVLDGLDMLVFTGGIGENDAQVRVAICSGLSWIGVSLDDSRNRSASNPVSDGPSRCQVLVLASQEDEQIARHTWALLT